MSFLTRRQFLASSCALAFCLMGEARGQSQNYQVSIEPEASLMSLSSDQFQDHSGAPGNLNFFDSEWYMESNSGAGASVTFAAGPFINQSNEAYVRDCQMRLRRLRNQGAATWAFDDRVERTRYADGKNIAFVTMSSTSAGAATVRIRVRFFTENNPSASLAAGSYVSTVTGTISAN